MFVYLMPHGIQFMLFRRWSTWPLVKAPGSEEKHMKDQGGLPAGILPWRPDSQVLGQVCNCSASPPALFVLFNATGLIKSWWGPGSWLLNGMFGI